MIRRYIQQLAYQLRHQALLSIITILGTALAICLIMVILIVYRAKTADYAPEVNRSRSLYVKWERTEYANGRAGHSKPSLWLVKEIFTDMETPEAVTAVYDSGEVLVGTTGSDEELNTPLLFTDDGFWKVHEFRFLAGKPFSSADFQSGMKRAVIVESVARRLFGGVDEAVGKTLQVNFADYTVCGVVEDVNRFCERSFAEVYAPYTSNAVASEVQTGVTSGNYVITLLARTTSDFSAIRAEVDKRVAKLNEQLKLMDEEEGWKQTLNLMGQPDDFRTQLNRKFANEFENLNKVFWQYGIIIAIILLVPAINLSGLTNTRMRRRLEELGLRRAFGATQSSLVWHVMNENLVLTLLGGIVGLLFAYLAIWLLGDWLLVVGMGDVAAMNVSMISPVVFLVAFAFCLLLNMLSAYIPAWRVAHTPIVVSLNSKL